jgi:CheY-like chemotaxis protein
MGIWRAFTALFFKDSVVADTDLAQAQRTSATILAIDDDQQFLDAIKTLLTDAGFNVLTSTSGPRGLELLNYGGHDVKVVLLDYHMPKFDGGETLQYLHKVNAKAKIVALTGADVTSLPQAFREGVDVFIQKPFLVSQLIDVLHKLVSDQKTTDPVVSAQHQ